MTRQISKTWACCESLHGLQTVPTSASSCALFYTLCEWHWMCPLQTKQKTIKCNIYCWKHSHNMWLTMKYWRHVFQKKKINNLRFKIKIYFLKKKRGLPNCSMGHVLKRKAFTSFWYWFKVCRPWIVVERDSSLLTIFSWKKK